MPEQISIRPEQPSDDSVILALQHAAFGPGAYTRAAFRVREQAPHDRTLSFVAERGGELVGSVRLTPIAVGERCGMLLGPLMVDPCCKGLGYGKALVRHALERAREAGCRVVILVGDEPYYGPLGFAALPPKRVTMPGPVDAARVLVAELTPGAAGGLEGMVRGVRPCNAAYPSAGSRRS